MIYYDTDGFPVESHGDGGDSSMREGMLALTTGESCFIASYEISWGMLTRHPKQTPWNNKFNFTRDQLIPMLAGLNAIGRHDVIRRVFVMQALRLMFCQDFQRDVQGSWKHPWPSTYMNDGQMVSKSFDFADPTLPNDWWCFIKGGRLWPLYFLYPLCLLFTLIQLKLASSHQEQNQVIAALSFHPNYLTKLYCEWNTDWDAYNVSYWAFRGEIEYATYIRNWVNGRIK